MTDYRGAAPRGDNDVATKPELWRPLARAVDGFDLDPAAGAEPEPIADERYTKADDGLTQPWFGTVWLNPPFSEKSQWFKRLVDQYRNGDVERAVAVAPVGTSADWFQEWFSQADVIAFLNGRAWYVTDREGHSSFSTMVGVWNDSNSIRDVLQSIGVVATVDRKELNTRLTNHD